MFISLWYASDIKITEERWSGMLEWGSLSTNVRHRPQLNRWYASSFLSFLIGFQITPNNRLVVLTCFYTFLVVVDPSYLVVSIFFHRQILRLSGLLWRDANLAFSLPRPTFRRWSSVIGRLHKQMQSVHGIWWSPSSGTRKPNLPRFIGWQPSDDSRRWTAERQTDCVNQRPGLTNQWEQPVSLRSNFDHANCKPNNMAVLMNRQNMRNSHM